jgi:hypothetical protein
VVACSTSSPFVHAYRWSAGFADKASNPATLPPNDGKAVCLKSGSGVVVASDITTPFLRGYQDAAATDLYRLPMQYLGGGWGPHPAVAINGLLPG